MCSHTNNIARPEESLSSTAFTLFPKNIFTIYHFAVVNHSPAYYVLFMRFIGNALGSLLKMTAFQNFLHSKSRNSGAVFFEVGVIHLSQVANADD